MRFTKTILSALFLAATCITAYSQETTVSTGEKYGKTLNIGLGLSGYYYHGYYGYVRHTLPVIHFDYEFDLAKSFTLAPFINFHTYSTSYFWGDKNYPNRYYVYRETVVPLGVKGTYYLDGLLQAGSKWDFYVGGSLGFAIVLTHWDDNYYGDRTVFGTPSPLFLQLHLGTEYHINPRLGVFLDLSGDLSTIGLAIHR